MPAIQFGDQSILTARKRRPRPEIGQLGSLPMGSEGFICRQGQTSVLLEGNAEGEEEKWSAHPMDPYVSFEARGSVAKCHVGTSMSRLEVRLDSIIGNCISCGESASE